MLGQCLTTAPTYVTIGSAGNWTNPGHWIGGPPPYALTGGAYVIPAGEVVEIAANFDINANLIVYGTLFISGKLNMPAGAFVDVKAGGLVTCCASGYCGGGCMDCGNSDKVTIGGVIALSGAGGGGAPAWGPFAGPRRLTSTGLPVTLAFFKAAAVLNEVYLSWQTLSEDNFDYFTIERSVDGSAFNEIGRVTGHGSSKDIHEYQLTDRAPISGRSYYRLKSTDFDGYTEYFDIVSVNLEAALNVSVYPNPVAVAGELNVLLNFVPQEQSRIHVTDLFGVPVGVFSSGGFNTIKLPAPAQPGTYFLEYRSASFKKVKRFVVK